MLTATIKQYFFRDELAGIVSFRASLKLKLVSCYSSKILVCPSQVSAFPSPSCSTAASRVHLQAEGRYCPAQKQNRSLTPATKSLDPNFSVLKWDHRFSNLFSYIEKVPEFCNTMVGKRAGRLSSPLTLIKTSPNIRLFE